VSAPLFFAFMIAIGVIFLILTNLTARIEALERRHKKDPRP